MAAKREAAKVGRQKPPGGRVRVDEPPAGTRQASL
jgi:hypothetical protein